MSEIHPAFNGFSHNAHYNGHLLKGGLIPVGATKLIMGTFPPPAVMARIGNSTPFFYYNSSRNHFWNRVENFVDPGSAGRWKWLARAKETEVQNVYRKIELAHSRGWAFMDIFSEIKRNRQSAQDKHLVMVDNVVSNGQLFDCLRGVNTITGIYCTYKTAHTKLLHYLEEVGYSCSSVSEWNSANSLRHEFDFDGRQISIILLYPATRSRHGSQIKNNQYAYYL